LKYKGAGHIGIYLGKLLGNELKNTEYAAADMIVPVPLHLKKKRKRGFNQSELIGRGLSEILNIQVRNDVLFRPVRTSTQTRKNRYERAENMEGVFSISTSFYPLETLTVLLIDDVVTTGSTLEACANELLKIPGLTVMIATVACA
jgi:ComF family protein